MNITIDKKYRVVSDERSYVLRRSNGLNKNGEELFESLCWHAEMDGVLKSYMDYNMKSKNLNTFQEFIKELKKERLRVAKMLKAVA